MFFTRSQIFSDVSRCSQDALECSKMFYRRSQDVLTEIPKIFNDVFLHYIFRSELRPASQVEEVHRAQMNINRGDDIYIFVSNRKVFR